MGTLLTLKNISKSFAAHDVLKNVTLDIGENDRAALVGRNGSGKTTIFRIISEAEQQDSGKIIKKRELRVGFMEQIPEIPSEAEVVSVLKSSFSHLENIKNQLKNMEENMESLSEREQKKYSRMRTEFESSGGYEIKNRIETVCSGLGISEEMKTRLFSSLSGGEKNMVLLARMILESPDLLLLDEPTNHLDMKAVTWLENFLSNYRGAVLLVSHDRYFLDSTMNKIIELEFGKTETYRGNFSFYKEEKKRRMEARQREYKNQQRKKAAMKKQITRFKSWSIGGDHEVYARKAKSLEKIMDKIEEVDRPVTEKNMTVNINSKKRSGRDVLKLSDISKSFDDQTLFSSISFKLMFQQKTALIGGNGTGKTTLIKIITGQTEPDSGEIKLGTGVSTGYLPQKISFGDENCTVFEKFIRNFPMSTKETLNKLARMLFCGDMTEKNLKDLSGGEKVRLQLALLFEAGHNFLILDEPTNHLDIFSREVMEEALEDYEGTVLFVSHDRYFINSVASRIIEIEDRRLHEYAGNYDYYSEKKKQRTNFSLSQEEYNDIETFAETENNSDKNRYENLKSQRSLRQKIEKTEQDIKKIEKHIAEIEEKTTSAGDDYEKAENLYLKKKAAENELEEMFNRLLSLNELHDKIK